MGKYMINDSPDIKNLKREAYKKSNGQPFSFTTDDKNIQRLDSYSKNKSNKNSSKPSSNGIMKLKPMDEEEEIKAAQNNKTINEVDKDGRVIKKIQLQEKKLSPVEEENIKHIFKKLFLFDNFPDDVLDIIMSSLVLVQVEAGDYLYLKGAQSSCFYIVLEGVLNAYDNDEGSNENVKLVKVYKEWDYFGVNSLMAKDHFNIVNYSVQCIQTAKLFVLNGDTFLTIRQRLVNIRLEERFAFLNTIIFFKSLDCIQKHLLADKMEMVNFKKEDKIINKGDKDKAIYLIKSGSVSCQIRGTEYKILRVSDYFGIVNLFIGGSRTLDIVAREQTVCFRLTEKDLSESMGKNYIEVMLMAIFSENISNNPTIADIINDSNMKSVFEKFKVVSYSKNEKINDKTKNGKRIVLVLEGNFISTETDKAQFRSGDIIGEDTLTNNVDIPTNLVAFPDCLTLEADLNDITDYLGEEFRATTMNLLHRVSKMKKMRFLSLISENTLKMIVDGIKKEKFYQNQNIITEGQTGNKFYIIIKGTVRVTRGDKILREMERETIFGELALMSEDGIRTATVTAVTNVSCYVMTKQKFQIILKEAQINEYIHYQMNIRNDLIGLSDLYLIQDLGKGKFGVVNLVHNKKAIYAIKAINRRDANMRKRIASYLIMERRIMLALDHPFITKMVRSFKNDNYVFLLLEYINGISLKELLVSQMITFNMNDTRFYIASMLLALDYLNHRRIIHRDIKPANIMINNDGYMKMIDFGTSKIIKDYTNTIIGTPHYMAPEVLMGKGYSLSCDYWSIGICAFELFYRKYPFGQDAQEIMAIYNEIMYSSFQFPFENEMFDSLNRFIKSLLVKPVERRLCTFSKIKVLDLFDGFDFEDLLKFRMNPPFKPSSTTYKVEDLGRFRLPYEEEIDRVAGFKMNTMMSKQQWDTEWAEEF